MRYGYVIVLSFCTFPGKIGSKGVISYADKFCRVKQGIPQVAGTTFFHMGIIAVELSRLVSGWGESGIGKYLIRGVKTAEITDFCKYHRTHPVADPRYRESW